VVNRHHAHAVPASLHDSLMARLDRLQPVKEVAQAAACIGREFEYRLIAAIVPLGDDALQDALARLAQAELIFRHGVAPEARYVFKHALVCDAAYESLLKSKRQEIHRRLTTALEAVPDTSVELLAHHATQAGLTEKAIGYWQKAASIATARPAYKEAISHLNQAIALCEKMGAERQWLERRLLLTLTLGQTSIPSRGYGHAETVAAFTRAQELAAGMSDAPHRFSILHAVWVSQYIRGDQDQALERAHEMVAWGQRDGSKGHMITALRSLAISQMITGAPALAEQSFTQALGLSGPQKQRTEEQRLALAQRFAAEPEIATRFHYALTVWSLGRVGEGRRLAADALAEARALRHVHTLGHALAHATIFAVVCRDAGQALALGSETIDFARQHDLEMWKGYGAILKAFALALSGQEADSIPEMETGFSYMTRTQTGTMVPLHHALHARSLAVLGRFDEAERHEKVVREQLQSGSERYFWPECERLIGDYLSLRPDVPASDIEAAYNRALALAREQQAKSWELYAALSLARYWAERGERQRAVELLAPLYTGFPDAGGLRAHTEAAELLDELK